MGESARRMSQELRAPSSRPSSSAAPAPDDARAARAALEALFAPKPPPSSPAKRESAKMVVARKRDDDPREAERGRLVDRLLSAVGRSAITRAADELARAGLEPPDRQEVCLQMLEH